MSSVNKGQQKQKQKQQLQGKTSNKYIIIAAKVGLWLVLLYASTYYNLQNLYVIVSGIVYIFTNLGSRKSGEMSAYSVFNKNFKKAAGAMDAQQMLLGTSKRKKQQRIFGEQEQRQAQRIDEYFKNESKYGNKPCYCQSGLKFKKCCLIKRRNQQKSKKKQL